MGKTYKDTRYSTTDHDDARKARRNAERDEVDRIMRERVMGDHGPELAIGTDWRNAGV